MNDDESLLAEITGDADGDTRRAAEDRPRDASGPSRGRRRGTGHPSRVKTFLPVVLVVAMLLAVGVGGVMSYRWITGNVQVSEQEETDYPGPGSGEAIIEIKPGDSGGDIAKTLKDAGVIRSTGPFTTQFAASQEASGISPGTYRLKKEMSSADALEALLDPASLSGKRITVPEGMRMSAMFPRLAESTGIPVEDFEAAAKDYQALGIPENPAGSAEGYFWPGTYDVPEEATAADVLRMMAQRMTEELDARGVAPEDRHRILTLASIAEKEARMPEDYGRVVRTIDNRLVGAGEAGGHPMRLQLDSTVAYASGKNTISTTPEERDSDSPYNTYKHDGLPVGPISNPGAATIDAAISPPEGPWLYWVTVNTDTGETKFAATKAEHDANVREWKEWAASKG